MHKINYRGIICFILVLLILHGILVYYLIHQVYKTMLYLMCGVAGLVLGVYRHEVMVFLKNQLNKLAVKLHLK